MKFVQHGEKSSPLYTSLAAKLAKAATIKEHGKDLDGAYRVTARKDLKTTEKK
jgi:hypothetical protein